MNTQTTLDEFTKVRCRKCGRAFDSEKALKIHMHSHKIAVIRNARIWIDRIGVREVAAAMAHASMNPEKLSAMLLEKYGDRDLAEFVKENFEDFKIMVDVALKKEGIRIEENTERPTLYIS
jgi:hypothetical protein